MKRIIIFSTAYLPFIGGAELAIKEITDRICDCEFDLITARMDKGLALYEKIGNVNIYRVGFGSKFDKFLLPLIGRRKVVELYKKNEYVTAWVMMASQASILACYLKKRFPSLRLVLTLQEGDTEDHLKRYVMGVNFLYKLLIRPWYELIFKMADKVQVISEYLGERARSNGVKVPIVVIPNGVNLKKFTYKNPEKENVEMKGSLGFLKNDVILITVSRLVAKNAISDIVRSLVYLPRSVKLLIVGEGDERVKIEEIIKNNKLSERVKMVGKVQYDDVPRYLRVSDIFVRPSLSEGMGNAFIEAMAMRLPVIATPVGGIVDFLKDKKTGLFCEVNDPQSIAGRVEVYMSDEELKTRVVKESLKMVRCEYGWDEIVKKMRVVLVE